MSIKQNCSSLLQFGFQISRCPLKNWNHPYHKVRVALSLKGQLLHVTNIIKPKQVGHSRFQSSSNFVIQNLSSLSSSKSLDKKCSRKKHLRTINLISNKSN